MEIKFKNFSFTLDWKSIVGLGLSIGGCTLLNKLSKRGQLESLELDLKDKRLSLNS